MCPSILLSVTVPPCPFRLFSGAEGRGKAGCSAEPFAAGREWNLPTY